MLDAALIKGKQPRILKMYIFWSPKHDKQLEKHAVKIDSILNFCCCLSWEKCPEKELEPSLDTQYRRYYTFPFKGGKYLTVEYVGPER